MNQNNQNENQKKAEPIDKEQMDKSSDRVIWRCDVSDKMITTGAFIEKLGVYCRTHDLSSGQENLSPREEGWTEEQDELNWEKELERGAAARILHMFMKIKLGIRDEEDISEAYMLRDLFDCRVCANHIAQIYVRGFMDAVHIGTLCIFDVHGKVFMEEADEIIDRLKK